MPERRTYREIANQIRELIYSRTLKPGDKLPSENELAAQFKAGRISVREALRMLEQAGLIFIKQGNTGGSFVKALDASVAAESMKDLLWQGDISVTDLTEARLDLEKLILTRAFDNIGSEELEALQTCVRELEALAKNTQQRDYPVDTTLTNFHILLARTTNNPVFPIMLSVLMDVTARVIRPGRISVERLKKHASSHRAVYEALKKRDLAGALEKMEKHLVEVRSHYLHENRKEGAK